MSSARRTQTQKQQQKGMPATGAELMTFHQLTIALND
jgi:hypothetical protein